LHDVPHLDPHAEQHCQQARRDPDSPKAPLPTPYQEPTPHKQRDPTSGNPDNRHEGKDWHRHVLPLARKLEQLRGSMSGR
jgi:hypothetical protein